MKASAHPTEKPRGVRDPHKCKVQAGGQLRYIVTMPGVYESQPMFWTDRPCKFPGHIRVMLRKPGTVVEGIMWRQLGGKAWWRLPEWPTGDAEIPQGSVDKP